MKKIVGIVFLFAMLIVSCDKALDNGNLDGMWKLVKVEVNGEDVYPENIYYSFQRHLVMMGIYADEGMPENFYMGCFYRNGSSMTMNNFYRYPGIAGECDFEELKNLYIFEGEVDFVVEHLGAESLVMSATGLKYYFRKW